MFGGNHSKCHSSTELNLLNAFFSRSLDLPAQGPMDSSIPVKVLSVFQFIH